ncbi:agmatinase [Candidatus Woesearchaeota archaeon]|nr:agmatinase [Candidatus Woesearchaeota archaeon]
MNRFGGFSEVYDKSKIVVVPVPYDATSTWIKGADKGPDAIIDASPNLEFYDIETGSEVYKQGIFTDNPVLEKKSPEKMIDAVEHCVELHLKKGKFCALLGGEHSVSIGSVRAHRKKFSNLSVLQLDAHSDLREEYNGSRFNHACVMARVKEICPIVQVGIRSMDSSELGNMDKKNVFFAKDIVGSGKWIDRVIGRLTQNVYVTIDVDVFDSGIMPSTGTPEPGGLSWYDVTSLLKKVSGKKNIVGFDVVELCPSGNRAPDFLAAKLVYQLLSYKFGG